MCGDIADVQSSYLMINPQDRRKVRVVGFYNDIAKSGGLRIHPFNAEAHPEILEGWKDKPLSSVRGRQNAYFFSFENSTPGEPRILGESDPESEPAAKQPWRIWVNRYGTVSATDPVEFDEEHAIWEEEQIVIDQIRALFGKK